MKLPPPNAIFSSSAAKSAPDAKIISLEILRLVAAFFVTFDHVISFTSGTQPAHARPVLRGFDLPPISSVLFFFVLSGFVMMTAHGKDFGRLRRIPKYFWRRICRIYPIYWLSLVANLYFLWPTFSKAYLAKILTLSPFQHWIVELNPPAWSLRFEMAFYIMFGISLLPYIGKYWLAAWIILVLWIAFPEIWPFSVATHIMHGHPHMPRLVSLHFFSSHCLFFFAGLAAGAFFNRWSMPKTINWIMLILSSSTLIFLVYLDNWGFGYPPVSRVPLDATAFALIILSLATLEKTGALKLHARLSLLGAMSYPLYLFHPMVLYLVSVVLYYHPAAGKGIGADWLFLLLILASVTLAFAVTFLFDRPLQRLLRRPSLA